MRENPAGAGQLWSVTCGTQAPDVVEGLLRDLPEWFGIETSNREYVAAAGHKLTYPMLVTLSPGGFTRRWGSRRLRSLPACGRRVIRA